MTRSPTDWATLIPLIHVENVTRRYGHKVALRQVSVDVPAGQFVALCGPNGAGKTTLIKVLATLLKPSEGRVCIAGLDTRREARQVRAKIGLVSHASLLYETLTARENLTFAGQLYGLPDPAERAAGLLAEVGLLPVADDPVRTFSRGMKQRLSIARALAHRPSLLLLDEPFAGLDQSATAALRDLLATWRAEGRTVLLTTHDLAAGLELADRLLILHQGRLVYDGLTAGLSVQDGRDIYREAVTAQPDALGGGLPPSRRQPAQGPGPELNR